MNTKLTNLTHKLLLLLTAVSLLFGLTGTLPLAAEASSFIVQSQSAALAERLVLSHGGTVTSRLEIIQGVGADLTLAQAESLRSAAGIDSVIPNHNVISTGTIPDAPSANGSPVSVDYPEVVGADQAWAQGVTGSGVAIAVVDSGIEGSLPQLSLTTDGQPKHITGWVDFIDGSPTPIDPNGHGSHVAGIIANSEIGADGAYNSVAPNASLVGVRVLNAQGAGTYESVILGLQWVLHHKDELNIRIVNLSLVAPVQAPYFVDPLDRAVTALWAKGLTVIAAAGNNGPDALTINVPGNNPYAITVGAFTDNYTPGNSSDDYLAPFSSAGPTLDGFVKPDLIAPGGHIASVVPANAYLATEYPQNMLEGGYFKLAGTSMSAAVVSGVSALILSHEPGLTNDQLKFRLQNTAIAAADNTATAAYTVFQQGAGRVSAPEAIFTATTESANSGMNIQSDLTNKRHYQGLAYWDKATQSFQLLRAFNAVFKNFEKWSGHAKETDSGKAGLWSGKAGLWSGKSGLWSGKAGLWSGKAGLWSGKAGLWSGGYTAWIGKAGLWSGKAGLWSGKAGLWSGKAGLWSGKSGAWSGSIDNASFFNNFAAAQWAGDPSSIAGFDDLIDQ